MTYSTRVVLCSTSYGLGVYHLLWFRSLVSITCPTLCIPNMLVDRLFRPYTANISCSRVTIPTPYKKAVEGLYRLL
jgi:hypothetical protein